MTSILDFFSENTHGFAVLVGILFFLTLLIQWTAWLFKWGRFGKSEATTDSDDRPSIRYMVAQFMIEIINDFRHLLASTLTLVFVVALLSVLFITWRNNFDIEVFKDGLHAVVASLGGLIGSVIGYYFGESAAEKKAESITNLAEREERQKGDDTGDIEEVDDRPPDSDVHESPGRDDENEPSNRN